MHVAEKTPILSWTYSGMYPSSFSSICSVISIPKKMADCVFCLSSRVKQQIPLQNIWMATECEYLKAKAATKGKLGAI